MDHQSNAFQHLWHLIKVIVTWVAALLGIGTVAGFVSMVVGVISAIWISVQLYGYLRYDLPIKRAKWHALRRTREAPVSTQPSDLC